MSEPREEKLLNGLKLLIWSDQSAPKVTAKLRIHNGAAFDPKDKMGVMALLGDILFPTEQARQFFIEDLEGSLEVASNYDYIQITATAKSEEVLTLLETLATAVTNPQITQENFIAVRDARLKRILELEKNPIYVADRAVAKRLFGDFPYGRSAEGTPDSLAKIDRADLLFAKERFLTADNATLAITGNVKSDYVYRAARRLFGTWTKADKKIPATFRPPEAPDVRTLTIELLNTDRFALRVAMNIAARSDKDFYAAQILTRMWQKQFCLNDEAHQGKSAYQPYLLRGFYTISRNTLYGKEAESRPINTPGCQLLFQKSGKLVYPPIVQSDFETVKKAVLWDFQQKAAADLWLDVDTYKLVSVKDELSKLNGVTFADVQRVAENLRKQPSVSVVVKKPGDTKQ